MSKSGSLCLSALFTFTCLAGLPPSAEAANRFCQGQAAPYLQPTDIDSSGIFGPAFIVTTNGSSEHRFLTAISYFGAMAPGHNPSAVFSQLCNLGINAVRIFADFWIAPQNSECSVAGAFLPVQNAVIDLNGNLNNTVVPPGESMTPFHKLLWVLGLARQHGLVVDLSFAHEVVANRSFFTHAAGIKKVAQALAQYPLEFGHVVIDVQNEFNSVGCPTRSNWRPYIPTTIADARSADPWRPVTASSAADLQTGLAADLIAVADGGSLLFAVHEDRGPTWDFTTRWDEIMNNIGVLWAARPWTNGRKPLIYAQEPCAAQYAPCNNPSAIRFFNSLRHAFRKGLAGWVFHTEALFYPGPGQSLGSGWTQGELDFLGLNALQPNYTIRTAIQSQCWGDQQTWISPCIQP